MTGYIYNADVKLNEKGNISLSYEKLKCPRGHKFLYQNEVSNENGFLISKTGALINKKGSQLTFLNLYCLEQEKKNYKVVAYYCIPPKTNSQFMVCTMISLPFLISTFLVYYITKEGHNFNWVLLMCFTATLLVAYISCIANYIYIGSITEKNYTCIFLCK